MRTLILLTILSTGTSSVPAFAQTGFDPRVIVFGDEREKIENTPIEQRPNRPLHFYGNTVRRRKYRTVSSQAVHDQAVKRISQVRAEEHEPDSGFEIRCR